MARLNGGKVRWTTAVVAAVCVLGLAATAFGQATTGALTGRVVMKSDLSMLPGALVEALHVPTGTRYAATTQENGRFSMLNVRVGGPYTVTATIAGFQPQAYENVSVGLGETRDLVFELQLETVYETVEVTAEAMPLISPDRMGSGSAVPLEQIQILPTVRRQIQDFARLNPYVGVESWIDSATSITVAGKNVRYNSIQIDGAVNNDLFGLGSTGTPGGTADTQPISLDSVQELQVVVSPYDIKQGGFTGGGVNAITRSGSNEFHGSVYGSMRDQDYVSDTPGSYTGGEKPIANFNEDQYGLRLGGRILRDKLFFFASGEMNRREQPTGWSADGSTASQYNNPAQAAEFRNYLISEYDYDPGSLGDIDAGTDSDLAFLRLDFNLGSSHQATLRHNYVDALRDQVSDRSTTAFRFETSIYGIASETNSTVLQLNSVFGANAFNVGRIGYQTIRDSRSVGVNFPSIDIGPIARRPELAAGTERFSGANSLDQDILEITDDFTFVAGDHQLTIGTHNEIFDFKNLYLPDFFGWYRFNTVADFKAGIAQDYSITFANGADPRRPTAFGARTWGLYVGDQWRASDNLTLTIGLRADLPELADDPSHNPLVYSTFGIDTSQVPDNMLTFSPRLGFNWNLGGEARQQLRGGIGVFAGRTPFVWISNMFGNTGIETTSLSSRNVPFVADPYNQPKNFPPGTAAISVDAVDPDFKMPHVMRATLAYDRELPWGIRGTVEGMYTQTIEDVYYQNINKVATGAYSWDGRPMYTPFNSKFRDVPYLTTTSQGEQKQIVLMLEKRWDFGLYFSGSYAYMDAESAFEGTSSRAISNWQYHPTRGDIYKPETSRSYWEVEDRFNFVVSQMFRTGSLNHSLALFYSVQSGSPFSILMGTDMNGDGYSTNDLVYVPNSADEIIIRGATPEQFETFLSWTGLDKYRGEVTKRNSAVGPWNRVLDFHYDLELPIKIVRTQVTFDILNLLNLIDKDRGVLYYISNNSFTPLYYRGKDAATGKPIYEKAFGSAFNPGAAWNFNDLRSRWQLKLGLRVSF